MPDTEQLPIAQRRTKRRCNVLQSPRPASEDKPVDAHLTPSKQRSKRVRFSAPALSSSYAASSGLTPFVGRTTLDTPRRRVSTPASPRLIEEGEIQFTPLRQVLDARLKRRISRNGLSREMNEYESERKSKAHLEKEIQAKDDELKRLRAELEAARSTSADEDAVSSSQLVVDEVETELAQLRRSFGEHCTSEQETADIDWSHVRRSTGTGSVGGDTIPIWEDDIELPDVFSNQQAVDGVDTDLLAMAVDLEAARSEKDRLFSSSFRSQALTGGVEMHFADSPARRQMTSPSQHIPTPPKDFYHNLSKSLKATTKRAEDVELALHAFEVEVKGLGFDGESAGAMLRNIGAKLRDARLELERLMPGETEAGFEGGKVLPEILKKLTGLVKQVRERDAELKSLREQQRTLKGNFEHALVAGEGANKRVKELERLVDGAAEEMLEVRMRSQGLEREANESKRTVESLITALEKYRQDILGLEELISSMEAEQADQAVQAQLEQETIRAEMDEKISDLDAQVVAEQTGRRAAEASAVERLCKIEELSLALSRAQEHSTDVENQLTTLRHQLDKDSTQHSTQLGALNTRISNLSTALASANAEVDKLKITKAKLEERIQTEEESAAAAVETMQEYFFRGAVKANAQKNRYLRGSKIRSANWELEESEEGGSEPMTPASLVRFVDVEGDEDDHVEGSVEVERGRGRGGSREKGKGRHGRPRRRTDSAIGMSSLLEEEDEHEERSLMTPELSSEADYGMVE